MMSIISKYISKNFLTMFSGILFVLVFVIFMGQFSRIFSYAMQYGANVFWVMSMVVYLIPDILVLSLPISFQIALLMVLTNLSKTGEIIALRAAGLSFKEITRPIFFIAVFITFIIIFLNGFLSPISLRTLEGQKDELSSRISQISLEPRTFINLGDWELYTENADSSRRNFTQVHLSKKNDNALSTKINATKGKIETENNGIKIILSRGQMQRLEEDNDKIITAEFDRFHFFIPLTQKTTKKELKPLEQTTPQLLKAIYTGKLKKEYLNEYQSQPGTRLSWALAPLIFFFLTCPVAFIKGKSANRAAAMGFSLVFILGYFGLLTVLRDMSEKSTNITLALLLPLVTPLLGFIVGKILWDKRLKH